MKFSLIFLLATLAVASPIVETREELFQRQANEACPIGYCTMNGGTTGGAGGKTVNVNNLNDLMKEASGTDAKIITVSGALSGNARVNVGSNKTILGKSGSCEFYTSPFLFCLCNGGQVSSYTSALITN